MHIPMPDFNSNSLPLQNSPLTESGAEVGRALESLFVSLLLKEIRQAGGEGGLFPGDSSDAFGGMFDQYLGQFIADSGGIGLSKSIQASLKSM